MPCTSPGQGQRQVLASAACCKGRGDACAGGQKGVRLRMVRQGAQLRVTASDPSGSQAPRMLEIPIDSFVDEAEGGGPQSHLSIACQPSEAMCHNGASCTMGHLHAQRSCVTHQQHGDQPLYQTSCDLVDPAACLGRYAENCPAASCDPSGLPTSHTPPAAEPPVV